MNVASGLTARLARLNHRLTVELVFSSPKDSAVQATEDLLGWLCTDTPVTVQHRVDPRIAPLAIFLHRGAQTANVSFWGTPSGYELEGLVYALECLDQPLVAERAEPPSIRTLLDEMTAPLRADLYVAPT